jgi:2-methylcitrate dehydratase PrpD
MAGLTETLARFIHDQSLADLPPPALERAKKGLADSFAVILAGAGSEVAAPLARYVAAAGERGDSPILGSTLSATPEVAALVNGAFGHALDYDDVLSIMPAHPSALIVAATCGALGDRAVTGRQLLEAYVLGLETGGKIGVGITVGHYNRGFHGTGTLGIFAALGALIRLESLDVETARTAFGIAASMASGLQRNFGTMTKPLHTGWAARSALAAVRLAGSGFTAAPDVLEAPAGFFAAYGVEASSPETAAERLGRPWVIEDPGIALKRFPCCYASHRAMDAVLTLRARLGFEAGDVERVECRMPPGGMRVLTYHRPRTGLEAKFSLEYALAAGVEDGGYTLASFSDAAVQRPAVAALLDRVAAHEDARCGGEDPDLERRSSGTRGFVEVEVRLRDGRRDQVRVDEAPGAPSRELVWSDVEAKFRDCAAQCGLAPTAVDAAFAQLRDLESVADLRPLIALLRPPRVD